MSRSIDRSFYESPEWRRCKALYLTSVNHLCELCREDGIYTPADIVHHKEFLKPENMRPELMYGFDNLMAVCLEHHNQLHGKTQQTRRWKFIDGELVTKECPPL